MKQKKYMEVKAYLEPEKDRELINTLSRISDSSGMSMSAVLGLILRSGAGSMEKAIASALKSGANSKVPTIRKRAVKR